MQDQVNSTFLPAKTFAGKDVNIIGDLDIVELSSIDYMLHAFQPGFHPGAPRAPKGA